MKTFSYLIIICILPLLLACSSPNNTKLNSLSPQEEKDGWELLFNGENIDNWKTFNGGEVTGWKIIDGVLHNSGVGSDYVGDIITKKQYTNFEIYLEWNIAPESNSGVF